MRKTIFLLAVLMSIAFAQTDLSNLSNQGCDYSGNDWVCQRPIVLKDATAFFKDDVGCFSTDGEYADLGCLTALEMTQDATVKDCKYKVVNDEIEYLPCNDVLLQKGGSLIVSINPDAIDYSGCSKYTNESLYVTECPYAGRKITFSGIVYLGENEENMALVTEMTLSKEAGVGALIIDNLLYIILVAAIIIVAYWVFAPHKPMFKERPPKTKEQSKEPIATRREKRYGRRL